MAEDQPFEPVSDLAIRALRFVLVDQRGPHAVVSHACHQVAKRSAGHGREGVDPEAEEPIALTTG
jgi:hypothetical protein